MKDFKAIMEELEDIKLYEAKKSNEPYYSIIKEAIYSLANNPRPKGYKKLSSIELSR